MNKNIKRFFNKPEYFYNPKQIIKRILNKKTKEVELSWGHKNFLINSEDTIGKSIRHFGVYDLVVCELITRLCNNSSLALDIGANRGYFTSLMSTLAKKVLAFEPHPDLFKVLTQNCLKLKNVELKELALSDKKAELDLYIPKEFGSNEGIASLEPLSESKKIKINTVTLDEIMPSNCQIEFIKIDVEGHEFSVLKGALKLIKNRNIRFILFEDFSGVNSKAINLLKDNGWEVYRVKKNFSGISLISVEEGKNIPLWEPANYLAHVKGEIHPHLQKNMSWTFFKKNKGV